MYSVPISYCSDSVLFLIECMRMSRLQRSAELGYSDVRIVFMCLVEAMSPDVLSA